MRKVFKVGSTWTDSNNEIVVITRERDKDLYIQHGLVYFCQVIGHEYGYWITPMAAECQLFEVCLTPLPST